jgi:hypothetical protein
MNFALPGSIYGDTPDLTRQKRTCAGRYNPVSDSAFALPQGNTNPASLILYSQSGAETASLVRSLCKYLRTGMYIRPHFHRQLVFVLAAPAFEWRQGRARGYGASKMEQGPRENPSVRQHRLHYHVIFSHARKSCANRRKLHGHFKKNCPAARPLPDK